MLDFDKDLLINIERISLCANKDDWKKLLKLSKKMGNPYSASLLARIFIREGLKKMEKEKNV